MKATSVLLNPKNVSLMRKLYINIDLFIKRFQSISIVYYFFQLTLIKKVTLKCVHFKSIMRRFYQWKYLRIMCIAYTPLIFALDNRYQFRQILMQIDGFLGNWNYYMHINQLTILTLWNFVRYHTPHTAKIPICDYGCNTNNSCKIKSYPCCNAIQHIHEFLFIEIISDACGIEL